MITADELEIHRKPEVQGYIREKMGELREYDRGFQHGEEGTVLFFWQDDGPLYSAFTPDGRYDPQAIADDFLRIPDPISRDSERPERGLWKMAGVDMLYEDGRLWWARVPLPDTAEVRGAYRSFCEPTPRLALLKALEWQIGGNP